MSVLKKIGYLRNRNETQLTILTAILGAIGVLTAPGFSFAGSAYPILLIHGLFDKGSTWQEVGLVDHFESFGWSYGGTFDVELEKYDTVEDVEIVDQHNLNAQGDVFILNFDTIENSNEAAIYLQAQAVKLVIAQIRELTGKDKVILVGHSMGGLAAAAYVVGDPNGDSNLDFYQGDVASFLTLGTPFGGSSLATLAGLGGLLPNQVSENALRDLKKNDPGSRNVFLFGGVETDVLETQFYEDVSCDGHVDQHVIRGISEMVWGADWPSEIRYSFLVGDWTTVGDCVANHEDQYLSFGTPKVVHAAHSSNALCQIPGYGNEEFCTEMRSFDAIVEGLDEPDSPNNAYLLSDGEEVNGFVTRFESAGVDFDYFRLGVDSSGFVNFSASLANPPVTSTTLRLLDSDLNEIESATIDSGIVSLSNTILAQAGVSLFIEVSGFAEPSDPGYGTYKSACDENDTYCPNCRSPYSLTATALPISASVELNVDRSTVPLGGVAVLQATVKDPTGVTVGSGSEVSFTTNFLGNFSGCESGNLPCVKTTDTSGVATVSFSSTASGLANIAATSELGGNDSAAVLFADGSFSISISPNPANVNLPATISVSVRDGAGEAPPTGTGVTFSTSYPGFFSGNNCVGTCSSPWTTTTDASGNTWIRFTSGVTGTAQITVDSSVTDGTVVPIEIVNPNANLNVSIAVGYVDGSASSSTYELEAVVTNSSTGAPVSGQRVDFTTSRGSLSPTYSFTGGTGVADVNLTVTSSGDVTVTASAGGNTAGTTFFAEVGGSGAAEMFPTRTFTLNGDVNGVDFSPNGATLVAVSYGDDLKAWNTSNWSSKWSTNADDNRVGQLSISPDNNYVLVNGDGGAEVYSLSTGGLVCVAGNPASKGILGTWNSNTTYFDTSFDTIYRHTSVCSTGSATSGQPGPDDGFERAGHMDYSPQKTWASVLTDEGNMLILNSSGSLVTQIDVTSSGDNGFDSDFSSDGSKLAAVAYNVAKVYNTSTWSSTSYSPPNLSAFRYGVTFIDNNSKLAIGGVGRVEVVNVSGGNSVRYGNVSGNAVELSWNESTKELAVGTSSGNLYIFKPLESVDGQAPTISISHPSDNYSTNQSSLTTTGRVTDATGVSSFTINGTAVSLDANGYFSKTVNLNGGSNTLTYAASDPGGNSSTATRTVTRIIDTIPPVISGSTVSPSSGAPGTLFSIQTTVIDGDTGVASVTATVRNGGGSAVATLPMSAGAENAYSATFNSSGSALGFYTIDITAVDSSAQSNSNTVNSATGLSVEISNGAPNQPSNPSPPTLATDVAVTANLTWAGGDPNAGDTVTYDVYLEAGDVSPDVLVCDDAITSSCSPQGDLAAETTYYWQVVARDNHSASTAGPVWSFTTAAAGGPVALFADDFESGDCSPWSTAVGLAVPTGDDALVFARQSAGVWTMKTDGSGLTQLTATAGDREPRLEQGVVAFVRDGQVYMTDLAGSTPTAVPNTQGVLDFDLDPSGSKLAITFDAESAFKLYTMDSDGTGSLLIDDPGSKHHVCMSWGRDGFIYYDRSDYGNAYSQRIWRIPEGGVTNGVQLVDYFSQCPGAGGPNNKVAFFYNQPAPMLKMMDSDGSNQVEVPNSPSGITPHADVAYDRSREVVYYVYSGDVWSLRTDGGTPQQLTSTGDVNFVDYGGSGQ